MKKSEVLLMGCSTTSAVLMYISARKVKNPFLAAICTMAAWLIPSALSGWLIDIDTNLKED